MKFHRRPLRLIVVTVLLFGVAAGLRAWLTRRLPCIKLRTGGEFRVFAVRYGSDHDAQVLHPVPHWKSKAWASLPKRLQDFVPEPRQIPESESSWDRPAVVIWCAWVNPETHQPDLSEMGKVTVTLDNDQTVLPESAASEEIYHRANPPPVATDEPLQAEDYREIAIVNPPRDSRHFHVKIHNVWGLTGGQTIHFTIDNPAYRQP